MIQYRECIELANQYFLIIGRHLNLEKKEADVANSILFKKNDTLYIIDTGALIDFRETLMERCNSLKPFSKIVLINTHGHCDHVGNNIVLEQLEAVEKHHYISAHDMNMMHDNRSYFTKNFKNIASFMADGFDAEKVVDDLVDFFLPLEVDTQYLKAFETLPSDDIQLGSIHWSGWKFEDSLYVLRSEGHTRGHVIFFLPEISHVHMGDETNGYCNLFHDCDNLKSLESHTKVLSMLNEGTANSMTDGHSFLNYGREEAKNKLEGLIKSHYIYENVLRKLFLSHPEGLSFVEIKYHLDNSEELKLLAKTANPNPIFNALMLLSKFRDFGLVPDRDDLANALFQFQGKAP